ncbi:MAG: hypothetical protein ACOX4L_02925 [Bacillota bacterium]|jgi:hypothetical protein
MDMNWTSTLFVVKQVIGVAHVKFSDNIYVFELENITFRREVINI